MRKCKFIIDQEVICEKPKGYCVGCEDLHKAIDRALQKSEFIEKLKDVINKPEKTCTVGKCKFNDNGKCAAEV